MGIQIWKAHPITSMHSLSESKKKLIINLLRSRLNLKVATFRTASQILRVIKIQTSNLTTSSTWTNWKKGFVLILALEARVLTYFKYLQICFLKVMRKNYQSTWFWSQMRVLCKYNDKRFIKGVVDYLIKVSALRPMYWCLWSHNKQFKIR